MASARTLARLDSLSWIFIFVGLLVLVLGIATHDEAIVAGWSLSVVGALATAAGVVMIVVRSRLPEDEPSKTAPENRA
jgi:uncharacterized membrane protein HdeD (DUF308 family)